MKRLILIASSACLFAFAPSTPLDDAPAPIELNKSPDAKECMAYADKNGDKHLATQDCSDCSTSGLGTVCKWSACKNKLREKIKDHCGDKKKDKKKYWVKCGTGKLAVKMNDENC